MEETEKAPPLTPEGNAALVDDFGGNKQLITVTTKAGNYFYILIDRANEDKKTAVHFLNQVDEADLMALMEDGKPKEEPPAVCSCTKKCEAGAVNTACPVCVTDKSKCTGKAPEPPAETPEPEKEKPAGLNPAALILLLALLGGGGVFAYLKLVKNKPKTKGNDSLTIMIMVRKIPRNGKPKMRKSLRMVLRVLTLMRNAIEQIEPFERSVFQIIAG